MNTKRPERLLLNQDQKVALIAPSFQFNPEIFSEGRHYFEQKYGVKTVVADDVFEHHAYFAGSDERRLNELYTWLTDPEVGALVAIRGGYGVSRIYPALIKKLRKHRSLAPKIVAGYSDLTILLNGLYQDLGWVTFHSPAIAGRAFRTPEPIEEDTFEKALFSLEPVGAITHEKMATIQPGYAEGILVGGCLTLVTSSLGTDYEINTDGKILFLEDVDERPFRLDRMLIQLMHAKKLDRIKGIVFGQMANCKPSPPDRDPSQTSARSAIELAIGDFLREKNIPAVFDFPAGHGLPQVTFPIGCKVEIHADPNSPSVHFVESGVR